MPDTPTPAELARQRHKQDCWVTRNYVSCDCGLEKEMRVAIARLSQAEQESEGRRKALLEKSEEVRREWMRAENAEAALARAEQERDASDALLAEADRILSLLVANNFSEPRNQAVIRAGAERHKRSRQQRGTT